MAFQTYIRLPLLSLVAAVLGCGRPQPHNEATWHGGDMLASGSTPQVTDSVPGDAILAGGELHFSGNAAGDYLGAGWDQTIGGRIHGAVRAVGGEIHVTAAVDRNATIAGGTIELDRTAVIGRNAYIVGGTVRIDGTVHEELLVSGGTVILNGTVDRNVEVTAGALQVGPSAVISGTCAIACQMGKFTSILPRASQGPLLHSQYPADGEPGMPSVFSGCSASWSPAPSSWHWCRA